MAKNITINLFEVSRTNETQRLSETLNEFKELSLEQRIRSDIRLEKIEHKIADATLSLDSYCLDFAKVREIGPGKMTKDKVVSDVGLSDSEFFGEETAALYVPKKKWLLVLNNHYGVGPSRMASYFNALDPGNNQRHFMYSIIPKIDQLALEKMQSMKQFAEIEISANVGAFENIDGVGESLLKAANGIRAHRIHLQLIANEKNKKTNTLGLDSLKHLVDKLLEKSDDVDKITVKGADEMLEAQDRFINLIEQKIRRQYSDRELVVFNHRYTFESKIRLLRKACRGWISSLS